MTLTREGLWTIYACPEHGPESINETYGWCGKYVGLGNGRPRGYITTDQWCHRDAEWITVQGVRGHHQEED